MTDKKRAYADLQQFRLGKLNESTEYLLALRHQLYQFLDACEKELDKREWDNLRRQWPV